MKKLEKKEFIKLTANIPEDVQCNCMHTNLVRLYTFGAKADYGCLDCGMESSSLREFLGEGHFSTVKGIDKESFGGKALRMTS